MWEQKQGSEEELPTWDMLDKFLQGRIRALSVAGTVTPARVQSNPIKTRSHHTASTQRSAKSSLATQQPKYVCGCCNTNHLISFFYFLRVFLSLNLKIYNYMHKL